MVATTPGSGPSTFLPMQHKEYLQPKDFSYFFFLPFLSPKLFTYQVDDLGPTNLEEREEPEGISSGIYCR